MAEYIEREAIMKFTIRKDRCDKAHANEHFIFGIESVLEYVKNLPAADVAPVVHGRWIEDHDYLKCAECGVMVKRDFTFFGIGNWNYCPNCGAKMDGGDGDAAD